MKEYIKNIFKTRRAKYITAAALLVVFAVALNYAFAAFSNRETKVVANITVAGMEYNMMVDGVVTNTITAPANETIVRNIQITSLNDIDSTYELIYINTPGVIVEFTSDTVYPVTGNISSGSIITIRIAIINTTSNDINVVLDMNAGFIHNTLELLGIITGPFSITPITVTFNANGAGLNTPTGCTDSGNNRVCTCIMYETTPCTIRTPQISRQDFSLTGFNTNANATETTGDNVAHNADVNFSTDTVLNAITHRNITITMQPNGAAWGTTTGWTASGVNRTWSCVIRNAATSCTTPTLPVISRTNFNLRGFNTNANATDAIAGWTSGATGRVVNASATYNAITDRTVTATINAGGSTFQTVPSGWTGSGTARSFSCVIRNVATSCNTPQLPTMSRGALTLTGLNNMSVTMLGFGNGANSTAIVSGWTNGASARAINATVNYHTLVSYGATRWSVTATNTSAYATGYCAENWCNVTADACNRGLAITPLCFNNPAHWTLFHTYTNCGCAGICYQLQGHGRTMTCSASNNQCPYGGTLSGTNCFVH